MQLWEIEAHPSLSIKGRFECDENGNTMWVLVAKSAWMWINKGWVEHPHPEIYDTPIYLGEEGFSALKHDSEFQCYKKNTDVIVYGKARSKGKRPIKVHQCRLLVDGHIDKTLFVYGSRHWIEHAGTVTASVSSPFIESDIDYTHALGGDERNRLGGGAANTKKDLLAQCVPCVFYPKENWNANNKNMRVAGFGALPPFFMERLKWAGTFDADWEKERRPLFPEDFDRRFYQNVPEDQQCKGILSGGERIILSGFSHDEPLSFRIPKTRVMAEIKKGEEKSQEDMRIHTVFIDTESGIISITYSALFPCQGQEHLLAHSRISTFEGH